MEEFAKNTRMAIDFKKVFETDEIFIQSLFLKVFKEKPHCVFIDFSKHTQDYLHLARIITRCQMENKIVTVGLVDYLSPPEVMSESIATGVTLTHIKSAESYDVVFDVGWILSPNEVGEHGFANATLKDDFQAGIPAKIGYIHKDGVHIETDLPVQKDDPLKINHFWRKKKTIPSREVVVEDISSKNLFYQFKYAVDLKFSFVDEFIPPKDMDAESIKERKQERKELIASSKKLLSQWLTENESGSFEKRAKVLVVDRQFHFYDNQQRTDKHAYTIRCVPSISDPTIELDRFMPQVIAYALEPDTAPEAQNTNEKLVQLMNAIKGKYQLPDEAPFMVIFNCQVKSQEFQQQFKYPHLMTTNSDLDVALLARMAEMFNKKLAKKVEATTAKKEESNRVYLSKTNPASLTEIVTSITITKLSETDMIFQSSKELPVGLNLHLEAPVDMHVHVLPSKGQGKLPEYYGLIHGIGEEQKKELRRFVNLVFFRDHDAQLQAETDEFKKLNDAKLLEKQEKIKTELEVKQKEEAAEKEKEKAKAEAEEKAKVPNTNNSGST